MFAEYIASALERAKYEIINDPEPYYASVPGLQGVWATGKTIEECLRELISTIEGWIVLGLRMGNSIPPPTRTQAGPAGRKANMPKMVQILRRKKERHRL